MKADMDIDRDQLLQSRLMLIACDGRGH